MTQGGTGIGGHRTSGNRESGDLDRLVPRDELIVTLTGGTSFTYAVDYTEVPGPFSLQVTDPTPTTTATLFA